MQNNNLKQAHAEFDLICIGAGSGGLAATIKAAKLGARCAIVESNTLGGTCVNLGCVPKKIMWFASMLKEHSSLLPDYGFTYQLHDFSWPKLIKARQAYIDRVQQSYQRKLTDLNIQTIKGKAKFIDKNSISVDGATFKAKHLIIATGSRPILPTIPGKEFALSSNEFFALEQQPKNVAIIGSGYIAVELAGVLAGLGSSVNLLIRGENILTHFDHSVADVVQQNLLQKCNLSKKSEVSSITKNADSTLTLHFNQNNPQNHTKKALRLDELDCIIFATGRQPNTNNLGLEHLNLKLTDGYIDVDNYNNSSIENIYAIGDVTKLPALTPVAIKSGRALAARLFANLKLKPINYQLTPSVLFSHPPIGTIGLSEQAAKLKYANNIKVYISKFTPMLQAMGIKRGTMLMKLITDLQDNIIGCHIVGEAADEIIQGFAVAISMGATKQDFDNCIAIHPTSSEELVTMP